MRILVISSEWPVSSRLESGVFVAEQVASLRELGIEAEVFAFQGNQDFFRYFKAWLAVRKIFRTKKFDLLHAHFGQSGLLALPAKAPLVVTFHGSDLQGVLDLSGRYTVKGVLLRFLSRFIAKRAKQVIVVSNRLIKFLPAGLPLNTIPCGVNTDLFQPISKEEARHKLGLPQGSPLILFAARPENPVKRYRLAEEAVKFLNANVKAQLVVTSNVKHEDMPLYMNACDVLLLTSAHEGSPMVIKEALACNLPIVSVDVGDVREQLQGVEGCVLCADESPKTIGESLEKVLKKKERISGQEIAHKQSLKNMAEKILEVYKKALDNNHPEKNG